MERTGNKILMIFLIIMNINAHASYRSDIYRSYINDNMTLWKSTIDMMEKIRDKNQELLTELINYQYGYIGYCLGTEKKDEAAIYLKLAEKNLKLLSGGSNVQSLINSYKSAFYGFRIGLNPLVAPFIGPKSVESARLAMSQDSGNPLGFVQYGNAQYYMPAVFGGSKKEAVEYYLRALEIMEREESYRVENWNYLSLLTIIAQAYSGIGDYPSAIVYYEKALKAEPGFKWVKEKLLPELKNKMEK